MMDVPATQLATLAGTWKFPPPSLQLAEQTSIDVTVEAGHLVTVSPVSGAFRFYKQQDGSFLEEDTLQRFTVLLNQDGTVDGFANAEVLTQAAIQSLADGHQSRGEELLRPLAKDTSVEAVVGIAIYRIVEGDAKRAEDNLRAFITPGNAARVEGKVNVAGYGFIQQNELSRAKQILELNTRLFPEGFNTWDSLGEAHMKLGEDARALECYQKSLQLNSQNSNAERMIEKLRERSSG
jgi:predicted Zn-dependent protease